MPAAAERVEVTNVDGFRVRLGNEGWDVGFVETGVAMASGDGGKGYGDGRKIIEDTKNI